MQDTKRIRSTDQMYVKSNLMISAKYKSTVYENKLLAAALYTVQNASSNYADDLVAVMGAAQLRDMFGNGNSAYSRLKVAANGLVGRTIGYEDDANKEFVYMNLVRKAEYKDGVCKIYFNKDLRKHLVKIHNKFTILSLPVMMNMTSIYSFRLYELLKSEAFIGNRNCQLLYNGGYEFYITLSELKLVIGVVDASETKVQEVLNGKEHPDYDHAVEVASNKSFSEWRDFKRRVLDIAQKEITEKTDLNISYKPYRAGKGAKVVGITFKIEAKPKNSILNDVDSVEVNIVKPVKEKPSDDDIFELALRVRELIREQVTASDIKAIMEAADYESDRIFKQYENSKKAKNIDNFVGWMIDAIKNDYKVVNKKKKNTFNEFEQNSYDFDELEKELLRN